MRLLQFICNGNSAITPGYRDAIVGTMPCGEAAAAR
jgi:hypothetical protein